jgi:hypothetical protein
MRPGDALAGVDLRAARCGEGVATAGKDNTGEEADHDL